MPLIKPPESIISSPRTGLITPSSTEVAGISPDYAPYVNVGGVLKGVRGMDISGAGSRMIRPFITPKTEKEVAAVKEAKVREYKGGLLSQGYKELMPNMLSKRVDGGSKKRIYELLNINPLSGDVYSDTVREKQYDLLRLQNTLSTINWRNAKQDTRNRLSSTARSLGYDIDSRYGQLVPKGYYMTSSGRVKPKTSGWFGTPEAMEMIKMQNPLYGSTVQRLKERAWAENKTLEFDPAKGWVKRDLLMKPSDAIKLGYGPIRI